MILCFEKIKTFQVAATKHYIEVCVVADDSIVKFHGRKNLEKYILTMMGIVGRVFKHKSLGMNKDRHFIIYLNAWNPE